MSDKGNDRVERHREEIDHQHVRLKRVEYELAELREHTQRIPALETALTHLQQSVDRIVAQSSRPFPIWNIISSLGVLSLILAGYATLITQPIDVRSSLNRVDLDHHEDYTGELHRAQAERIAALETYIQQLEKELRNVDHFGSRRWVEGNGPEK